MSVNHNSFTINWQIKNFSKIDLDDYFKSPAFRIGVEEWSLHLHFHGHELFKNYLTCCLLRKKGIGDLTISYTFHLIDPAGRILIFEKRVKTFTENDSARCPLVFIELLKKEIKKWSTDNIIIRCIIVIENQRTILPSDFLQFNAKTKMSVNRIWRDWRVKKPHNSNWYQSKVFECSEDCSLEVILTTSEGDILIEIMDASTKARLYLCGDIKMHLVNEENVVQASASNYYVWEKSNDRDLWDFPTFFTIKTLKEKKCIHKGCFILIIEFITPTQFWGNKIDTDITFPAQFTAYQNDFRQMLSIPDYSDVTLKAGGVSFQAHKNILSCRSPAFETMLDCYSFQNQTGVLYIEDMESDTMKILLNYLYSGIVDAIDFGNALKLLVAADEYQVKSLTEKCADILALFMSPENVCDIIAVAYQLDYKPLKTSILDFVKHHADEFLSSSKWHEWFRQNGGIGVEFTTQLTLHAIDKNHM